MKKNVSELSVIYNLLDQDFNQRNISLVLNATSFQITAHVQSMPLINAAQTSFPAKQNMPVCALCGYNGHTVDTCYKFIVTMLASSTKERNRLTKPHPILNTTTFLNRLLLKLDLLTQSLMLLITSPKIRLKVPLHISTLS